MTHATRKVVKCRMIVDVSQYLAQLLDIAINSIGGAQICNQFRISPFSIKSPFPNQSYRYGLELVMNMFCSVVRCVEVNNNLTGVTTISPSH